MKKKDTLHFILKIAVIVVIVEIIIFAAVRLGHTSYVFGYRIFTETAIDEPENAKTLQIEIDNSMSLMNIAEKLQENGLVRDARVFWLQVELSVYKHRIQNGTFTLSTSMTPREIMQVLSGEGPSAEETTEAA